MPTTVRLPTAAERGVTQSKRHSRWFLARMAFRAWRVSRGTAGARELQRFLDGVSGQWPTEHGEGTVLVACNELYYREFGITFLLSIEQQAKPQAVHLHLCKPSDATLADVNRRIGRLRHVRLTVTRDDGALAAALPSPSVYYAAARFLIASTILATTDRPVLCLDIDGIARKPIWPAIAGVVADSDLVLTRRRSRFHIRKILASAVAFNPGPRGQQAADVIARTLAALLALRPAYHVDQVGIFYAMKMAGRHGPTVGTIPAGLFDFEFHSSSTIWTAKGWQRKSSDRFLEAKAEVHRAFAAS